ncbi:hypothetical protein [Microbacterium sp. H1-D42]|uniref:hypothetical protein n=1 Tax=Microbacterium sp. H1-D42 TaxID=2925844 RepID=UPI001F531E9A|nr:hypothetical protein [Microbacterium sp. H1-D42]UNK70131.1 hypothetical protein MNR00_13300 [Microbacterium sp. H1-D42]
MRLARTIAFWLLAAGLLACHVIVIQHSLTARFWEDEAFNLTVPLNLLAGLGYSSDGALSGSTITPFDPRISTGPTVLLPVAAVLALGVDPVLGARMVPLAFWALLLAGLALLGIRTVGRWGALVAAAVPLAFNGFGSISPIQGPADLLGEIPAAALLVWALIALPRRAWLAGLLVGLAVQAKLIVLLALPAFAVALWVLAPGRGWQRILQTLKRAWLPLILVGVPTLLMEVGALVSLGPSGFVEHLRGMVRFVRGGGQHFAPTTVTQKLETLAGAWFVPMWAAVATAALCVALAVAGLVLSRASRAAAADADRKRPDDRAAEGGRLSDSWRSVLMLASAAGVGALAFVGWWSTAAHTPLWVRHPASGVLAFFPIIVIVALWGARVLFERAGAARVIAVVAIVLLSASLAWSIARHVLQTAQPRSETLATQRADVAPIREWVDQTGAPWLAAHPWGAAVGPIVMSGAHVGLSDADAMAGVPRLTGLQCDTEVLVEGGRYRVCAAPIP